MFIDSHLYVITNRPDIIALQEVGPHVPALRGYASYILGCDDGSSTGLVMYVRSGLPVTFREKDSHCGIEFITTLHTPNQILFANLYIHSVAFSCSQSLIVFLRKRLKSWDDR